VETKGGERSRIETRGRDGRKEKDSRDMYIAILRHDGYQILARNRTIRSDPMNRTQHIRTGQDRIG